MTTQTDEPGVVPSGDLLSLAGRRAVVTGAGRGIGAAIATRLADAGAAVVVADIDGSNAEQTAKELQAAGFDAWSVEMDVSNTASAERAADQAVTRMGGIDIWVNNAGVLSPTGPVESTDDELFDRIVSVNLRGAFNGARAAVRRMAESGVIVNVASTTAFRAIPFATAYVTTKTSIVGMTRSLAVELGAKGIRVLGVAPGFVSTPGSRAVIGTTEEHGIDLTLASQNPLGHPLTSDDVARVVLFCASDLAAAMTGVVIPVDGGSIL